MRGLTLRRWLADLRVTPEERRADCAERCMEALYDSERAHSSLLSEHEEATIEAQRRRWSAMPGRPARP